MPHVIGYLVIRCLIFSSDFLWEVWICCNISFLYMTYEFINWFGLYGYIIVEITVQFTCSLKLPELAVL